MADKDMSKAARELGTVSESILGALRAQNPNVESLTKSIAESTKGLFSDLPRLQLDIPVPSQYVDRSKILDLPPPPGVRTAQGITDLNHKMDGLLTAVTGLYNATLDLAKSAERNDRRLIQLTWVLVVLGAAVVALAVLR